MEDAHIARTDIVPGTGFDSPEISVFGVFDGHGGIYCSFMGV
jgi:serine/threonine protein phosphatase PrpC